MALKNLMNAFDDAQEMVQTLLGHDSELTFQLQKAVSEIEQAKDES